MIVSRKKYGTWKNLEGKGSRLSGSYYYAYYKSNSSWHRLYRESIDTGWDINDKHFDIFKEISYDSF